MELLNEAIALQLPDHHQTALKHFAFDPDSPGTVLADFQLLLDEASNGGIPITPKTGEPNLKFCAKINPQLQTGTPFTLKRPGQSHYCHLRSLFWLARVGGFVTLDGKKRVILDNPQIEAWSALNPAERYFSLLDLWLFHANPRLIGGYTLEMNAMDIQRWWTRSQPEETVIIKSLEDLLRGCFGVHHLALLETFGFVTITLKSPQPYGAWPVERIKATPWGSAMMALLSHILAGVHQVLPESFAAPPGEFAGAPVPEGDGVFDELGAMKLILQHMPGGPGEDVQSQSPEAIMMHLMMNMQGQSEAFIEEWQNNLIQAGLMGEDFAEREAIAQALGLNFIPPGEADMEIPAGDETDAPGDEEPGESEYFDLIQPFLKPLFPTYERALPLPRLDSDFDPGLFVLTLHLGKGCWRSATLLGSETLETLANVILFAFDFDNDHLHEFILPTVHGNVSIGHPAVARGDRSTGNTLLGELGLVKGSHLGFIFDFGDCWEFEISVKDILNPPPPNAPPTVVGGLGDAPPQYPDWDEE